MRNSVLDRIKRKEVERHPVGYVSYIQIFSRRLRERSTPRIDAFAVHLRNFFPCRILVHSAAHFVAEHEHAISHYTDEA